MRLNNFILNEQYVFDGKLCIWKRPDYTGIAYSDGDEVENRILDIVKNASDVSLCSLELKKGCTDWPSLYHLTNTRANVLRPFGDFLHGKRILEIGAGCGAVTRYLGESGAIVLALEGSPRRSGITSKRTRDLENITVLSERFEDFDIKEQFDVITLIGVLEYAPLFSQAVNPAEFMLKKIYSLLKPDGIVIIAIENQLGLKYFAGAPEDHLGMSMVGLEDRYTDKSVRTFGRSELDRHIRVSGFEDAEFLYPFPDYKLPITVLTEKGVQSDIDLSQVISQSNSADPQAPVMPEFCIEQVWMTLGRNKLLGQFANSFIAVGKKSKNTVLFDDNLMAFHYSTGRRKEFQKVKEFRLKNQDHRSMEVYVKPIYRKDAVYQQGNIIHTCRVEPYIDATTHRDTLSKILNTPGWSIEDLELWINTWIKSLKLCWPAVLNTKLGLETMLHGEIFDAIPRNLILTGNEIHYIDREWTLLQDFSFGWLLFRTLLYEFNSIPRTALPKDDKYLSYIAVFNRLYAGLDLTLDDGYMADCIARESEFQFEVTGINSELTLNYIMNRKFRVRPTPEEKNRYYDKVQDLIMQNHSLTSELNNLNNDLKRMTDSKSWKVTKPLRLAGDLLRGIRNAFIKKP